MSRWPAVSRWPAQLATRGSLGYLVMGLIVLCGAVWSFGALVEIGNIATDRANLTTLPAPYAGYLFAGSVDLFIFFGYLKCYGPAWQITLSVFHILAGLFTSVWLQYQHSKGIVDPVLVSVIPAIAVAVSLDTWVVSQLIDWRHHAKRPAQARAGTIQTAARDAQVVPARPVSQPSQVSQRPSNRPKRAYAPLRGEQARRVEQLHAEGWSAARIGPEVGVTRQRVSAHLNNGNSGNSP